jgi:hypothetical protein
MFRSTCLFAHGLDQMQPSFSDLVEVEGILAVARVGQPGQGFPSVGKFKITSAARISSPLAAEGMHLVESALQSSRNELSFSLGCCVKEPVEPVITFLVEGPRRWVVVEMLAQSSRDLV